MKTSSLFLYAVLTILAGPVIAQQVFYPLDIGTRWQWGSFGSTGSFRLEITRDTLVSNGHRYSIIPEYWSIPERWERQEGNRVYRYSPATQQEWLLFDFSKSPGDTINSSPYVKLAAYWTDTLFGTTRRRIWGFTVGGIPGGIDAQAGAGYKIVDSIGLIEFTDWNSSLRVYGARIGSRNYGAITKSVSLTNTAPTDIQLEQNYPNPFNGQATINFSLPRDENVDLRILDVTGKLVERLANGRLVAGTHRYLWDASSFSSGVYYCELLAANDRRLIRLVHIK